MKIVKILGGLGNQMFQYAFYLAVKHRFPKEAAKIDIFCFRGYPLHNGFELNHVFAINESIANIRDLCKVSYPYIHYRLWQVGKYLLPKRKIMYKESLDAKYNPNIFNNEKICYYEGYWQNEKYFKDIRSEILKIFKPRYINDKTKELSKILTNKSSVSIHIRRGDYIKHPWFGGICNVGYYKRAISKIESQKDVEIYCIFSNDIPWCKTNIAPLLKSKKIIYVDWNKNEESHLDIYLMSLCKYNIIANSSFSWWGAWLNEYKEKIVICPKKWNNIKDSKFELPESWTKI